MMADETETTVAEDMAKATAPSVAELEAKIGKLENQVNEDLGAATKATDAFSKAVKSGDVDKALELADARTQAQTTIAKSTSQLETARKAVTSAKYAANAEVIAGVHNDLRDAKLSVPDGFVKLEGLGVTRLVIERSEETGKIIINSAGPTVKRTKAGGNGTGSRGQSMTVDGQEFASASAANRAFFPDSGPLNRESIVSKLVNAGHEVS